MPSYIFKDLSEVAAFANDTNSRLDEILNAVKQVSSPPVQQVNAAGTRTVTSEVTAPVAPAPPVAAPTLPVPPPAAITTHDDTESANALRLALGTDFSSLTDYQHHGYNTYVPDLRLFCHAIFSMNESIMTSRHFYTASRHWHPVLTQAYYTTAFLMHCLNIQVTSGQATTDQIILNDSLRRQFKPETISIPGPLVPFFVAASSGRTNIANVEITISPSVTTIANADATTFGLPASAAGNITATTPRIPSVLALLDQYVQLLALNTATLPTWNAFGQTVLGTAATAAPGPNTTYADQVALNAALTPIQAELFRSPGFNNIVYTTPAIAGNFVPVAPRIAAAFPTAAQLAAVNATSGIDEYCALNIRYGLWFNESSPVFSHFAKFFKASRPLANIAPVGSASGQVEYQYHGAAIAAAPTTRFTLIPNTLFSGRTRSKNVSPADDLDSAVTQLNTDSYINVAANHRLGPFFQLAGYEKESRQHNVYESMNSVIASHFFTITPAK